MNRKALVTFGFVAAMMALGLPRARAQASQLDTPPPPPPGAEAPPPSPPAAAAPSPTEPAWDPLRAAKNLEVGAYYLKTGNYDAAIDRFQEAARAQPGLAKPYLLLGKTYEKKKDPKSAVAAYQKYLDLYPSAPDQVDVQKAIVKLNVELQKGQSQKQPKQTALR